MTAVEPTVTSGAGPERQPAALGAWAYFEGSLVPLESAQVSVATHALNYGTSIFEGIRAYRQAAGGLAILFGPRALRAAAPQRAAAPRLGARIGG